MEIRSILVNVGLGPTQAAVRYAVKLAERFNAEIIGLGVAEPNLAFVGVDGAQVAADYYAIERQNIEGMLERAEERFRATIPASVAVKWRSFIASPTEMLIDQARCADLVVVATGDVAVGVPIDAGHLILACGRPVIMVADTATDLSLDRALVAWKDTREARRALSDALPLLRQAREVRVVTLSEGDLAAEAGSLSDVVEWLRRHGITAQSQLVEENIGFLDAVDLMAPATPPDLVVAGGYGHSRFREWLFGGVTSDLLDVSTVNRLFAN